MADPPGNKLLAGVRRRLHDYLITAAYILASTRHGRALRVVQDNTGNIGSGDIVLFCTLRNEAFRIPWFLDYYRNLGVGHFVFVDNGSTDGFSELTAGVDDISVWHTTASYKNSKFGMHWLNYLLRKHGRGRWCLTVDPDEFILFPHSDQRNLKELTSFLGDERKRSFFCLLLDMYNDGPVDDAHYRPGQDPLEVCPWFDPAGYVQTPMKFYDDIWVQGGPRRRVFFRDDPQRAPALNKTPLVKWRWSFSYVSSMHIVMPRYLNRPHQKDHLSPTGCLLHFKFFSTLKEKASEEIQRGEHFDNSVEYHQYNSAVNEDSTALIYEKSERFQGWRQLEELGLMNRGQWF